MSISDSTPEDRTTASPSDHRFIALEVIGDDGRKSLNNLLAALGAERYADLTDAIALTVDGDLHFYFTCPAGTFCPSSEIAPGVGLRGGVLQGEIERWLVPGRDIRDASALPTDLLKLVSKSTPDQIDWEGAI